MSIKLSIRQKLLTSFIMVIIFSICFSLNKITEKQKNLFYDNLILNSKIIGKILTTSSSNMIIKKKYQQLDIFTNAILDEFNSLKYIIILNHKGEVLQSSIKKYSFPPKIFNDEFTKSILINKKESHRIGLYKNKKVFDIYIPLLINKEIFGLIRLGFSLEKLDKIIISFLNYNIILGIISIIIALIITISYTANILYPIKEFIKGTKEISNGDFSFKINIDTKDEFEILASSFNNMAEELYRKQNISSYISNTASTQFNNSYSSAFLGGTSKIDGILFSDIRKFTTISEKLKPNEIVEMLNSYYDFISCDLKLFNGDIDKFIGDAIMVIFPCSNSEKETAFNLCSAAFNLISKAELFSKKFKQQNLPEFKIGVGISLGTVIEGNIGSKERMNYTVIGDIVNQSSRLESFSKNGNYSKIMVTEKVMKLTSDIFKFISLGSTELKGKEKLVNIYEIIDIDNYNYLFNNIHNKEKREKFLKLLSSSKKTEIIDKLIELCLIRDETNNIIEYIECLKIIFSRVNCNKYIDKIMKIEEKWRNVSISSQLASLFSNFSYNLAKPYYLNFLNNKNSKVVAEFINAIGYINNKEILNILKEYSNSKDPLIQSKCFIHLFFKGKDILPDLFNMLQLNINNKTISVLNVLTEITIFSTSRQILTYSPYYENITSSINSLILSDNNEIASISIKLSGTMEIIDSIDNLKKLLVKTSNNYIKNLINLSLSKIT